MLKLAHDYTNILRKMSNICFCDKFKWLNYTWCFCNACEDEGLKLLKYHEFVSIDNNGSGEVVGYIRYYLMPDSGYCAGFTAINFTSCDDNEIFLHDVRTAFNNIFHVFGYDGVTFTVVVGDPMEKEYDRLVKEMGGSIFGVFEKYQQLSDRKLYDVKVYKIYNNKEVQNSGPIKIEMQITEEGLKYELPEDAKDISKTNQNNPPKQRGRKNIDTGKIIALHNAGWSNVKIADEMGLSPITIGKYVKTLCGGVRKPKNNAPTGYYSDGRY